VLALHAVNDLPGALVQIRRALKPDGLFIAALFGGDTLHELRLAFAATDAETLGGASSRVAPFADVRELGALLQRAGFTLPVADVERTTVQYREMSRLFADLRALGETNVLAGRRTSFLSRRTLQRLISEYAARFQSAEKRFAATFDIVFLTGWAAHEKSATTASSGQRQNAACRCAGRYRADGRRARSTSQSQRWLRRLAARSDLGELPLACHGPPQRAIQAGIRLVRRADAQLLGGPIKWGHDILDNLRPKLGSAFAR